MDVKNAFSRRLAKLLVERSIKQVDIAEEINVNPQTFNKYLKGSIPTPDTLVRLCEALNVSLDFMLKGEVGSDISNFVAGQVSVPLLGYIPAGPFSEAIENNLDDINVSEHLLSGRGPFYALKVEGESMINAGIKPGATAILKYQNTAQSGDIVALIFGGEASLKKLFLFEHHIIIHAENAAYPQITVPRADADQVQIAGKLLLVISEY